MASYPVTVEIKRGYVKPNDRVAVSMKLPEGAETIIDLENVYIVNPDDPSVKLLTPIEVNIETEDYLLVALFKAASLFEVSTDNNKVTMMAGLIDAITPAGETVEYEFLSGTAEFNKSIVGRRSSSSGRSVSPNGAATNKVILRNL